MTMRRCFLHVAAAWAFAQIPASAQDQAIALGDYWGGDFEGGRFKRPGKTPLGISFELTRGASAVEQVPPLVHMDRQQEYERYFAADKK